MAKKIRSGYFKDFDDITIDEINNAGVGGNTNFKNAFNEACKYLNYDDDWEIIEDD